MMPEEKRTLEQNSFLWALLGDVAEHFDTTEKWKEFFLSQLGHEHSSTLSREQFTELLELVISWGISNGVEFRHLGDSYDKEQGNR